MPALAAHFSVHLVELPGYGRQRRHRHVALADTPDWLADWARAAGLEQASWVGHSMGGAVCIQLAVGHAHMVSRLVLVDAAGVPVTSSLLGYGMPLARAVRRMAPSFLPVLARDALHAGPFTLLRSARQLTREDVRSSLHAVSQPTLIMWGERDTLVPLSVGQLLHREIAGSQLVVLPGAGHVPMYDRPEAFSEAVIEFLSVQA